MTVFETFAGYTAVVQPNSFPSLLLLFCSAPTNIKSLDSHFKLQASQSLVIVKSTSLAKGSTLFLNSLPLSPSLSLSALPLPLPRLVMEQSLRSKAALIFTKCLMKIFSSQQALFPSLQSTLYPSLPP